MAQTGSYEKRDGWWLLRYREQVVVDGERKTILRNRKLATLQAGDAGGIPTEATKRQEEWGKH